MKSSLLPGYVLLLASSALSSLIDTFIPEIPAPEMGNNMDYQNFTEIVGSQGYDVEEHTITTLDGYILTTFRMSNRTCRVKSRPVILLHGLLQSSDSFLDVGRDASLAYLLADSCQDLWVANNRGNYYGRAHTKLNPDSDPSFWYFTIDEMGLFDIPANIDYILQKTGYKTLNFVSFSQGGGVFYTMAAAIPEYCKKINRHVALAPGLRLRHTKNAIFHLVALGTSILSPFIPRAGIEELLPRGSATQQSLGLFCSLPALVAVPHLVCSSLVYLLDSFHEGSVSENTSGRLFEHFPAGTSLRNVVKYAQSLNTENFQMYDYESAAENKKMYNSDTLPVYDLTRVNVPTVLIHGAGDQLVVQAEVDWLLDQMPNIELKTVEDPEWNHLDHAYSSFIPTQTFPIIIQYLN